MIWFIKMVCINLFNLLKLNYGLFCYGKWLLIKMCIIVFLVKLKKFRKKIFCFCYCILLIFFFKIFCDGLLVVLIIIIWYLEKIIGRYISSKYVFLIKIIYCKFYKIKYFFSKIIFLFIWCYKCNKIIKKISVSDINLFFEIYICVSLNYKNFYVLCELFLKIIYFNELEKSCCKLVMLFLDFLVLC